MTEKNCVKDRDRDDDLICWCCGKNISKYKLFNIDGDDVTEEFGMPFLTRVQRPYGPFDIDAEIAKLELWKHNPDIEIASPEQLKLLVEKYGREKGERFWYSVQAYSQFGKSLECRECVKLSDDEYFRKLSGD